MNQKYLWMAVEPNEYELPLAVAESAKELGKLFGVSGDAVAHCVEAGNSGKLKGRKFVKVLRGEYEDCK